jgi:uncharacterized protein YoaH (UPF0181 family)
MSKREDRAIETNLRRYAERTQELVAQGIATEEAQRTAFAEIRADAKAREARKAARGRQ